MEPNGSLDHYRDREFKFKDTDDNVYAEKTFISCRFRSVGATHGMKVAPKVQFIGCTFENCIFEYLSFTNAKTGFFDCHIIGPFTKIDSCKFHLTPKCHLVLQEVRTILQTEFSGTLGRLAFIDCHIGRKCSILDTRNRNGLTLVRSSIDRNCKVSGIVSTSDHSDVESFADLLRAKRKTRWDTWGRHHPIMSLPMKGIWLLTDYGHTTKRLLVLYPVITFIFSLAYLGVFSDSPLIDTDDAKGGDDLLVVQCLYFSIITTLTVGFGDIHPQLNNKAAMLLTSLHAMMGSFLWAALIQRLTAISQE
jgi:hypothetical protein